jgi:hypothetical protein
MTSFTFNTPESGLVKFKVMDSKGSVIYTSEVNAIKGENSLEVSTDNLKNNSGVFFYEFIFGKEVKHGKMIRVN